MTGPNLNASGGSGDAPLASDKTANLSHDLPERSADTRPLAAYRLGLKSREFWTVHQFFCENPCGALAEAVALDLAHLRADLAALAEDITAYLSVEMGHVLDKLALVTGSFSHEVLAEFDRDALERHARRPPGRDLWVRWTGLADRALAEGHGLRGLYDFGAALGQVLIALSERNPRLFLNREEMDLYYRWTDAGIEEPLPDIGPLVLRARDLPDELVWMVRPLSTLRQLGPKLDGTGRSDVLEKLLMVHEELCPFSDRGRDLSPGGVLRVAYGLDDLVQEALAKVGVGLERPLPVHDMRLLHWDEEVGELRYAHIVLKTLGRQAKTAKRVLARFQEKGWHEWVPSPFEETYPEQLKGALRTLGDVKMIQFHRSGENGVNGVLYKWVDDD